jgi:hypothetical protein
MIEKKRCVHYWMIEPAHGPTSKGVCRMCDLIRAFTNAVISNDGSDWSKIAAGRAGRRDLA